MKFFEVTTMFFDNGAVSAAITDRIEAARRPKMKMHSGARCDVYRDYFPSLKEARDFVAEAAEA